jgi:hypothetical protein
MLKPLEQFCAPVFREKFGTRPRDPTVPPVLGTIPAGAKRCPQCTSVRA